MGPLIWISACARTAGFAAGWAGFTVLLTLASRLFGWGPGFSNLLPYALAAIGLSAGGHLVRLWLGERAPRFEAGAAPPASEFKPGGFRRRPTLRGLPRSLGREARAGLLVFFRGTASCNNFLLLSVAYFIGIGLSALLYRLSGIGRRAGKRGPANPSGGAPADTYWTDLNLGKQDADAYYRPF